MGFIGLDRVLRGYKWLHWVSRRLLRAFTGSDGMSIMGSLDFQWVLDFGWLETTDLSTVRGLGIGKGAWPGGRGRWGVPDCCDRPTTGSGGRFAA